MTAAGRPARASWALVAAVLGSALSFIDGTAVNVALPIVQRDLHASAASGQWVVESYAVFLAALILIGGSLGDVLGRRKIFGVGIALFALASIVCALAPTIEILIAGRCLQGIGGALATPGSLALISANFSGEARGRAIGTWSGASAITAAIGPVLGGTLVQLGSWRWVFIINVPIAAVVLVILALRVDESRDMQASRTVDFTGAALATLGLGSLVYGLIRCQNPAFDRLGIVTVVLGVLALGMFVAAEARSRHPMVRLDFFRTRPFAAANWYTFFLYAALGGSLFFVPFDLINVQHYPPSLAGAALLPMIGVMVVFARYSGGLVVRVGARVPLVLGGGLAAAGFTIFAFAGLGHGYWTTFFPGAVVLGCGLACAVAPLTTTVMDALAPEHAGIASGVNNAVSRTAGLLAIAGLGIVLATVFDRTLTGELGRAGLSSATRSAVARERATIVAGHVPATLGDGRERALVAGAIARAYADGFRIVMLVSALLALVAAIVALDRSFRRAPPSR